MAKKEFRGLSFFKKLLITLLGVVLFVSISFSVIYYFFSKHSIEQYANEAIGREIKSITHYFNNDVTKVLSQDLHLLSENPLLDQFLMSTGAEREITARGVERMFLQSTHYMKSASSISYINYLGQEEIKVNRAGRVKEFNDLEKTPLFTQISSIASGEIAIEGPFSDILGKSHFLIAINKTDPDIGEFGGAVIMDYSLENFLTYLTDISIFGENPIWVFTPEGQVLKQPLNEKAILDPRPFSPELHGDKNFTILSSQEGLIACSDLSIIPGIPFLRIYISIPSSLLLKDLANVLRFLSLVFAVLVLVIIFIAFFISKYLTHPIMQLSQEVADLPRKGFLQKLDIESTGEVKLLVESFNDMISSLQNTTVSKDFVDNIIHTMLNTLLVLTPEGKIKTANKAALSLLKYTEKELIANPLGMIIGHDVAKSILDRKVVNNEEFTLFTKDGKETPVLFSSNRMLNHDGDILAIVCLAQDMSEKKEIEDEKATLEAQLRQAHKMEAIGTLAGGIAHDFNNILMAIIGYAELAKLDIKDEKSVLASLDEILGGGQRATDLVRQILTFSRKSDKKLEPLSPHIIINESLKLLRASIPATVTIKQEIEKDVGLILGDPTKIHQVVVNLFTNALHSLKEEKGTLKVKLGKKELKAEDILTGQNVAPGLFVELIISDTGQGMDAKTLERVFDPFFTTKEVGKGTGMGLSVVHGIVQDHGGIIRVESDTAKGSSFYIYFPSVTDEVHQKEKEKREQLLPGTERILLVDDEPVIVNVQKSRLEQLGYQVTGKSNSLEALEEFRSHPENFDLIITDQTMPGMSGAELSKEAIKIRPDIPIILCTGYSSILSEEKAVKIGIRKFVMKPIAWIDFAKNIRQVLDGK